MAEQQELDADVEKALHRRDFVLGCALTLVLLLFGGAVGGAMAGAHLFNGGVFAYLIGAIIGALIVCLFEVVIFFPSFVFGPSEEDFSEKVTRLQKEVQLRPNDLGVVLSLGDALAAVGRHDEAGNAYQKAIQFRTDDPTLYMRLGFALATSGRPDKAIQAYQEAVRVNKQLPKSHFKLGLVLQENGRLDEAIAEYREVIRLQDDHRGAPYNLGVALRDLGRLDEAIAAFRDGNRTQLDCDESDDDGWSGRGDERCEPALRETELMARAADRLQAVLKGEDRPKDASECLIFARLCILLYLKQYAASTRFFDEAFAKQPDLAEDLDKGHRYSAASVAARAGCGRSGDAGLDEKERAWMRRQALDWLQADLKAWGRVLENDPDKVSAANRVNFALPRWLADPDLAGVCGSEALTNLPEAERQPWQELWNHVDATLKAAQKTLDDCQPNR